MGVTTFYVRSHPLSVARRLPASTGMCATLKMFNYCDKYVVSANQTTSNEYYKIIFIKVETYWRLTISFHKHF
jgi:hypothetical protein